MAIITEPMALDKSFNTTENTPRSQADVLAGIEQAILQGMGRQANEVAYDNTTSGLSANDVQEAIDELADEKVDKVNGKGLSTNDYTDAEKTKLAGIEAGAQVNVQSDWAQTDSSADDFIKNKQLVTEPIEELQNDVQSTLTATGNPLTLTNVAPINAESLVVELLPKQDLHGQSAPYVGGAGKNKLPMTVDGIKAANTHGTWSGNAFTWNGIVYTILTDDGNNVIGIDIDGTLSGGSASRLVIGKNITLSGNYLITGGKSTNQYIQITNAAEDAQITTNEGGETSLSNFDNYVARIIIKENVSHSIFYPMIRLSTETDPTFAPYSNICPITGYTECDVDDVGFNQWDEEWEVGAVTETGEINSSLTNRRTTGYIAVLPNTEYYITSTALSGRYAYYDANKDVVSYDFNGFTQNINTTPTNACYLRITLPTDYGTTYNHDICINISKPTGTPKNGDYLPYQSTSATIQFGQTVYGAEVDFDGGTSDEWEEVVYDGSNDEDWATDEPRTGKYRHGINLVNNQSDDISIYADWLKGISYNTRSYDVVGIAWLNKSDGRLVIMESLCATNSEWKTYLSTHNLQIVFMKTPSTISTPPTPLKLLKGTNNLSADGVMQIGYQPDNVIGEVKGEIENATPISGTVTATLLHEEDQGEDWIVGFTGEINGHFDTEHFDYYLTARYSHAYNTNTQILNMDNCTDGDYVQIWQTGTLDFSVDGGVTVTISVTATKLTFTVNCIGASIFGIYSSSETTGQVKYLITPARKG